MNDSISILEQLVTAIEQAGVNVAPTYQEYMPLAFAIANGIVDEVGRCADSITTLDLSQLFRGRGGGPK